MSDHSHPDRTHAPRPTPKETLQGDRLCMQCLHPLAGRQIERDGATGLLFVRCGECGEPSAVFEYPTAAPWVNRMKAVAASTLTVLLLLAGLALALAAGGFTAGITSASLEEAAQRLADAYRASGQASTDKNVAFQRWEASDSAWLATAEGAAAVRACASSTPVVMMMLGIGSLGLALSAPFALFLSIALMRLPPWRRAMLVAIPALTGSLGAALVLGKTASLFAAGVTNATWESIATETHFSRFAAVCVLAFAAWAVVLAVVGPPLAALLARLAVPPRDRRLIAWIWEWRGKQVPRD